MPPTFLASPMSPLRFRFPDEKAIVPDDFPASMPSQSWPDIVRVRLGLAAAPDATAHLPSLTVAFQVPPPSPEISYWMTALTPAAFSGLKRLAIMSNVSLTVGIGTPPLCWLFALELGGARLQKSLDALPSGPR